MRLPAAYVILVEFPTSPRRRCSTIPTAAASDNEWKPRMSINSFFSNNGNCFRRCSCRYRATAPAQAFRKFHKDYVSAQLIPTQNRQMFAMLTSRPLFDLNSHRSVYDLHYHRFHMARSSKLSLPDPQTFLQ